MSFRDLKQNKQQQLEKLTAQFSQKSGFESDKVDDRFWYPATDKAGNGLAIIRFLPTPDGEDSPSIKLFKRSFQGPTGKWYINNCLSTIGQDDPVNDLNNKLLNGVPWKEAPSKIKEIISARKRKTLYISNIYVVKDPANPENEGKVFLFNYGQQIFTKIQEKMNPQEMEIEGVEPEARINPFDLWEGANFKLKIYNKEGKWRNYEKSEWMTPGPLFKDDKKLEEIYNQEYKLQPFLAPDQFKSREALQKQLDIVIGNTDRVSQPVKSETLEAVEESSSVAPWESESDADDEFFRKLEEDAA